MPAKKRTTPDAISEELLDELHAAVAPEPTAEEPVAAKPAQKARAKKAAKPRGMTSTEALVAALTEFGSPVKTRDLVERALTLQGWTVEGGARCESCGQMLPGATKRVYRHAALRGLSPDASLSARLATSNLREDGLFKRVAPGLYDLRDRVPA